MKTTLIVIVATPLYFVALSLMALSLLSAVAEDKISKAMTRHNL